MSRRLSLGLAAAMLLACLPEGLDAPVEARCGDGWVVEGVALDDPRFEACDDGNTDDSDGCRNDCRLPRCGDGVQRSDLAVGQGGYEACDDGNNDEDDGCRSDCTFCGDGLVQEGLEACDDGNGAEDDACRSDCSQARCGDGVRRTDREEGAPGYEACDDGNLDDYDACLGSCVSARCGDGFTRNDLSDGEMGFEACDDGNDDDFDACPHSCEAARCGDGYRRRDLDNTTPGYEACDDGNEAENDFCLNTCVVARCGDARVSPREACDDGNENEEDGCTNACRLPTCGDGEQDPGEDCDDGNAIEEDLCLSTCILARCGDGLVRQDKVEGQPGFEACDDGNEIAEDACLVDCRVAQCGDGVQRQDRIPGQAGFEACDDGDRDPGDGCSNNCQLPGCGDGVLQAGEGCDDGNAEAGDACTTDCEEARCGDGFRRVDRELGQEGHEACDDGNEANTDACVACQQARCGDGFVRDGVEACDDGNEVEEDGCSNNCSAPGCGDGVLAAGEACDDGNDDDSDACVRCQHARCGDGAVHLAAEACDDGNEVSGDGCSADCLRPEAVRLFAGLQTTCALLGNGGLRCWGSSTWSHGSPPGGWRDVQDFDLGSTHSCALRDGGEVWCWGIANHAGPPAILGDGVTGASDLPIRVAIEEPMVDVAAGDAHSCVRNAQGRVWCWGLNNRGQLGDGTTDFRGLPVAVMDGDQALVGAQQLAIGTYQFSCALVVGGRVKCWGYSDENQAGGGRGSIVRVPAIVSGISGAEDLVSATSQSCASGGARHWCWGANHCGQFRQGTLHAEDPRRCVHGGSGLATRQITGIGAARTLAVGYTVACAIRDPDGDVLCWGNNGYGELGIGETGPPHYSVYDNDQPVVNLGQVAELSVGFAHVCARRENNEVWCWGQNDAGQLGVGAGLGDNPHSNVPLRVPGF